MKPTPSNPYSFTQRGDDFFHTFNPEQDDRDWTYLRVGQTEWRVPIYSEQPTELGLILEFRQCQWAAERLAKEGLFYSVQRVGNYIRVRRLAGPVKKLSDWKSLGEDQSMLVDPSPTSETIEKVLARAQYLWRKGQGLFGYFTDDEGGLWVKRQPAPI